MTLAGAKRTILAGVLSVSLALATTPTFAFADTSDELKAQLDVVEAELNGLYEQSEQVSEELNDTRYQLGEVELRIEENTEHAAQTEAELNQARTTLSTVVSEDYKGGTTSLLNLILDSDSIESLVSNMYYAVKVSRNREEVIVLVKEKTEQLAEERAALEADREELQQLESQQEQLQDELQASIDETEAYVGSLSTQLQEALAAEEAARQEAARRAAEEEAARRAAEEEAARQAAEAAAQAQGIDVTFAEDEDGESESAASGGSLSSGAASTIVNAALSQVGTAYVWGASSPGVAFDCSGLVSYCYSVAGYSVPHSSAALAAYCNKPASEAVAGDIVWRAGHVGICIGNGQVVEAFSPGVGVGFGTVSSFARAGSPA